MREKRFDIIVIGAGAAGLVIAIGGAKAGKKVLLVEKGEYGGDCTNFGCVPSKSLIASSHVAHLLKHSEDLGICLSSHDFNADGVFKRTQEVVQKIRAGEEPSCLNALGVQTINGKATFLDHKSVSVNGEHFEGKDIVIATGSSPVTPSIEGIEKVPFLTNETVFSLTHIPKSMIFIGGGPICSELSQAFSRLGAQVTIIEERPHLLAREVKEAQQVIERTFRNEGISILLEKKIKKVSYDHEVKVEFQEGSEEVKGEALFVGIGRAPNIQELQLENAGIEYTDKGIHVDCYGRTNVKHIWAAGDAIGPPFFTHYAENQARAILTNLLLPLCFKKSCQPIPRCTYTDPEVASIGLTEDECNPKKIAVYRIPFSEVDRCITKGRTEGFLKIVTKKWSSKILGATIVGPRAGEMLMEISVAMYAKLPLRKLRGLIHPYPIENFAIRKAADLYLTQTLLKIFRK